MSTGTITRWIGGRGFGFIVDDTGGPDIFFHISNSPHLRGRETELTPHAAVEFEKKPSEKKKGTFEAYNVRLRQESHDTNHGFHNPYTFVPSPPRDDIGTGRFAGDFDPLKATPKLDHASFSQSLWTGKIPIKLTTVTPLLLPDVNTKKVSQQTGHETYDTLHYLPESSLRGMLRSAYEVATNSRYGVFGNADRLAYRMAPRQALKLLPAVIESRGGPGQLVARLYPGTSQPTKNGPGGNAEQRAMYAAMLNLYGTADDLTITTKGYRPKTGDEVWAQIVLLEHQNPYYLFWKAVKAWPTNINGAKPNFVSVPKQSYNCYLDKNGSMCLRMVKGLVLITNKNMGNKHDERIFFDTLFFSLPTFDVSHLRDSWRMRIRSYRDAHSDAEIHERKHNKKPIKAWESYGNKPGKTAWSPHQYEDGRHRDQWGRIRHDAAELQVGDMVYARCTFDCKGNITGIQDLYPVMISRELYDLSPTHLLDMSLRPAASRSELSPAERLFGWAPPRAAGGEDVNEGYRGRLRVVCEDDPLPDIVERIGGGDLPLTILGQPKPAQGRFYVASDRHGSPQTARIDKSDAGYGGCGKGLRGRKQYWHHAGLEASQASAYWKASVEDRTQDETKGRFQEYRRPDENGGLQADRQNRSITGWIKPGTVFRASLHVHNLQPEEIGALLWLLSLPERHYFRLGYGKPFAFGSVRVEVDNERRRNRCLPLATGEHWKEYYSVFDTEPPARLDAAQQDECIEKFKGAMTEAYDSKDGTVSTARQFDDLPFITGFLQVLSGPNPRSPIHYPRSDPKPNPAGENYRWFVDNEKGSKISLPAVGDQRALPYHP